MASAVLRIKYTGAEDVCTITASASAKTLSSAVGAAGATAADPNFGTAGTIDLTGASVDTLSELKAVIDAYDDYSAEIYIGPNGEDSENILSTVVNAKDEWGYILFTVDSVLDTENALVSWEKVKSVLDLDDEDQAKYERLINAASSVANRFTGRKLAGRDYTITMDGPGTKELILPEYPINSITSIYVDTAREFGASTEITDYLSYTDEGILYYESGFPSIRQCVRITYNAGFPVETGNTVCTAPEDVQIAVIEIIKWYEERLSGSAVGVRAIQNPDGIATQFELDIPLSAKMKLAPYVKERI